VQPHRAVQDLCGTIMKTAAGGEINCLDPGDFYNTGGGSTLSITHSITIDCAGTYAGFLVKAAVAAITIGGSGITVNLRNIVLDGGLVGTDGIDILNAANVVLENVTIQSFTGRAIHDTSSSTSLGILNSNLVQNAGPGLVMGGTTGSVALVRNSIVANSTYGVAVAIGNGVTVQNSRLDLNTSAGGECNSGGALYIVDTGIQSNTIGIQNFGGAVTIDSSDIVGNGTAISGATSSFGNNRIFGNTSAGTPPTLIGLQ
jgi:hypothetical protein